MQLYSIKALETAEEVHTVNFVTWELHCNIVPNFKENKRKPDIFSYGKLGLFFVTVCRVLLLRIREARVKPFAGLNR